LTATFTPRPTDAAGDLATQTLDALLPNQTASIDVPAGWLRRTDRGAVVFGPNDATIDSLINGNLGIEGTITGTGVFINTYTGPETLDELGDTIRVPGADVQISEPESIDVNGLPGLRVRIDGAGGQSIFVVVDVGEGRFLLVNAISEDLNANLPLVEAILTTIRIQATVPDTATPGPDPTSNSRQLTATAFIDMVTQEAQTATAAPPTSTQTATSTQAPPTVSAPLQTATAFVGEVTQNAITTATANAATGAEASTPTPVAADVTLETRTYTELVPGFVVDIDLPPTWVTIVDNDFIAATTQRDADIFDTADLNRDEGLEGPAINIAVGLAVTQLGIDNATELAEVFSEFVVSEEGQILTTEEVTIDGNPGVLFTFDAPIGTGFFQIHYTRGLDVIAVGVARPDAPGDLDLLRQITGSVLVTVPTTEPTATLTPPAAASTTPTSGPTVSAPLLTATAFIDMVTQQAGMPTPTPTLTPMPTDVPDPLAPAQLTATAFIGEVTAQADGP